MNKILVLGNGFDLACGLPTKYTDFLKFLKYIAPKRNKSEYIGLDERIESLVNSVLDEKYDEIEPYKNMILNNVWVQHFFCVEHNLPENRKWMDFEAEMARVIRTLDDYKMKQFAEDPMSTDNDRMIGFPLRLKNYPWARFFSEETYKTLFNTFLYDDYQNNKDKSYSDLINIRHERGGFISGSMDPLYDLKLQSYSDIRDALLSDLKDLISLLDYYLKEYVSKLKIQASSVAPQILDTLRWFMNGPDSDNRMVLSFNYTDALSELMKACPYDIPTFDMCHIHGEIGKKNMVIGIDDNEQSNDVFWGQFEKYYQKIHNGVDGSFYDFANSADYRKENHEVKVIGHSFAITDKHPLKKLLEMPNAKIDCFYYKDSSEIIRNATAIIGKDAILEKALGKNGTLRFVQIG